MLRLHAEKTAVVNRRLELLLPKRRNRLRRFRTRKESARHDIHAHIRALRRENHRDEEFERRLEFQRRLCIGIESAEDEELLRLDGFRYSHISSSATSSARESVRRAQ